MILSSSQPLFINLSEETEEKCEAQIQKHQIIEKKNKWPFSSVCLMGFLMLLIDSYMYMIFSALITYVNNTFYYSFQMKSKKQTKDNSDATMLQARQGILMRPTLTLTMIP